MTSQAFDTQACELVSTLFSLYMAGGVFSIVRDLILRVFYVIGIFYSFALFVPESLHEFIGDGDRPLRISFLAVSVNLFLDWFFTFFLSCGAQGMTIFFFFLLSPVLVLLPSYGSLPRHCYIHRNYNLPYVIDSSSRTNKKGKRNTMTGCRTYH